MFAFDGFGLVESASLIWLIVDWIIRISALFFVPRNRKPTSGTAWLMVIFLFPIGGLLLFLIIGNPKLPQSRREAQKTLDGIISWTVSHLGSDGASSRFFQADVPEKYAPVSKLSESLSHLPAVGGNKIALLPDYDEAIRQLVRDIDSAKHFVHIEYFIIVLDEVTEPVFAALGRAVRRGVQTRVMYDWFSVRGYPNRKKMLKRLKADGVMTQAMLPFKLPGRGYVRPDLRNHRKLAVIDGHIGHTGSQNLVRRNYHRKDSLYYDELVVRLQGPIVLELSAIFTTDWFSETAELLRMHDLGVELSEMKTYGSSVAQILPSGPGYEDENNLKLFTGLIHAAREQITITNPYFVPDDALSTAIISAARRGVTVTMLNSKVIDQILVGHAQRSFYEQLLKAGVRIQLYDPPILLHSKFMTIDDDAAIIGSSNFDMRSFQLDLEVTCITYDQKVVKQLRDLEKQYIGRSKRVKLADWQQRPRRKVLLDNIARLTSALQ